MAEVLEGTHEVNFTWFSNIDLPNITSVEILLAPARSVWDDHFNEDNYTQHTVSYDLTLNNGVFGRIIPLKTNIYHFLFRINCTDDFAASCNHSVTYLANGRMLNYVNVGEPLDVLFNNNQDLNEDDFTHERESPHGENVNHRCLRNDGCTWTVISILCKYKFPAKKNYHYKTLWQVVNPVHRLIHISREDVLD